MNLGFAALGLGWLVGPTLAEAAVRWGGAPRTLLFQAAAYFAVFGLLAAVPLGAAVEVVADAPAPTAPLNVAVDLRFWTLGLVLLLYIPIASSIETWSRPLLRELCGDREPVVDFRQRLFWLAFLAARVLSFWAMRSGLEPWVLVTCAGRRHRARQSGRSQSAIDRGTGLTVLGLCLGPLLPGIFGLIHAILPHPGLILGSALGAATLWQLLIDPALARTLQTWSPRQMMRGAMLRDAWTGAMLLLVALTQPEPATTPRPVHEVAKKDTLRTFLRKLFVRQK